MCVCACAKERGGVRKSHMSHQEETHLELSPYELLIDLYSFIFLNKFKDIITKNIFESS